ncbi:MAG: hypothetical protein AAGC60_27380 [Acidobacteriota bacterium]
MLRPLRPLRPTRLLVALWVATLAALLATAVLAAPPARTLLDVKGLRASVGEKELERLGYRHVGGSQSAGASTTLWREARTDRCVAVRTVNGVYETVTYAPITDCQRAEQQAQTAPPPAQDDGSFATVCGVVTGGQTYAYECRLRTEGCQGEGYCRSFLTFPDQTMRLDWQRNNGVEVRIEGLAPQRTTTTFADGQTRFVLDGKAYFVYRTEDRARREVAKLRN